MDIISEDSKDCAETIVRPQSEGMPIKTTRANTNRVPLGISALDVGTMHRLLGPHEESSRPVAEINNALERVMNGGAKRSGQDCQLCFGKMCKCSKILRQ
jgi:hypothetical protein